MPMRTAMLHCVSASDCHGRNSALPHSSLCGTCGAAVPVVDEAMPDVFAHFVRQAYDRAAICARGVKDARLNFPLSNYTAELESLRDTPLEQLAATLR